MNRFKHWMDTIDRRMSDLDHTLDEVFGQSFGTTVKVTRTDDSHHVDASEDRITITVDVPGFTYKDVDIDLDGDRLYVTATGSPRPGKQVSLKKTFSVSEDVDPKRIEASVKDGLLTVVLHHLPEKKKKKAKKIKVTAG